jgi:hypothetical protein
MRLENLLKGEMTCKRRSSDGEEIQTPNIAKLATIIIEIHILNNQTLRLHIRRRQVRRIHRRRVIPLHNKFLIFNPNLDLLIRPDRPRNQLHRHRFKDRVLNETVQRSSAIDGAIAVFREPGFRNLIDVEGNLSIVKTLLYFFETKVDDRAKRRFREFIKHDLRVDSNTS